MMKNRKRKTKPEIKVKFKGEIDKAKGDYERIFFLICFILQITID